MKQSKVGAYKPNYPKKILKGAILTTAAAVAIAGTTGCDLKIMGGIMAEPTPTDELVLDGETMIDEPTPEPRLEGEPAVDENGDIIMDGSDDSDGREKPALQGKIAVPEDTPEP
ncbi:MAG: hypothetical protein II412_06755 [Clostridia bacterium]|nr:hypothetical protein [Clostridia bacterium]